MLWVYILYRVRLVAFKNIWHPTSTSERIDQKRDSTANYIFDNTQNWHISILKSGGLQINSWKIQPPCWWLTDCGWCRAESDLAARSQQTCPGRDVCAGGSVCVCASRCTVGIQTSSLYVCETEAERRGELRLTCERAWSILCISPARPKSGGVRASGIRACIIDARNASVRPQWMHSRLVHNSPALCKFNLQHASAPPLDGLLMMNARELEQGVELK
jgi:hypothetical protein